MEEHRYDGTDFTKNKKILSYLTHYKKTTNGIQFRTLMRNIL